MDGLTLDALMRKDMHVAPLFEGVYAADTLPHCLHKKPALIIRYLHGKGAQLEVSVQKALSLACSSKGRLRVFARTKLLQSGLLVKRGTQSGLMDKKGWHSEVSNKKGGQPGFVRWKVAYS